MQQALVLARELAHPELTSGILANLGAALRETGEYDRTEVCLLEALELAQQVGHHVIALNTQLELGELQIKQQRLEIAERTFADALEHIPEENQELSAMALFGLAKVSAAQGKISVARVQASNSLARFEAFGNARSAEVQAWLKALPPATSNGMH